MRAGTRLAEFLLHFFSSARILMLLGILPRAIWLRLGWAFSDSLYIGCCCSPADLVHFLLELCSVASHTVWWAHGAWGGVGHGFRAAGSLGVPCNELKAKPVCAPVTRPSGRVARALAWLSLCSHGHPSKLRVPSEFSSSKHSSYTQHNCKGQIKCWPHLLVPLTARHTN